MVEFRIKVHPEQHVAYLPRELRMALGNNLNAVADRTAVLLYPERTALEDVLKSLDMIKADIEHAVQLKEKKGRKK